VWFSDLNFTRQTYISRNIFTLLLREHSFVEIILTFIDKPKTFSRAIW